MKGPFLFIGLMLLAVVSCNKSDVQVATKAQDFFYLENNGAQMPVLVEGNTASGVFIIYIHGGPGGTAIGFNNTPDASRYLEQEFAMVYYDQRGAGGSQGNGSLVLRNYIEDLKHLVQLIQLRYPGDNSIFLMSHSWGGLIAPGFLTEGDNQNKVKGWINLAGAHNYILNDSLTREYMMSYAQEQIDAGNKVKEWRDIKDRANSLPPDYTLKTSRELNNCSREAEALVDDIVGEGIAGAFGQLLSVKFPFSSSQMLSNGAVTYLSDLNKEIMKAEYSSSLENIQVPVLCISGKYDFTVPSGLAQQVMERVSSTDKSLYILSRSGHILMNNQPDSVYGLARDFVRRLK